MQMHAMTQNNEPTILVSMYPNQGLKCLFDYQFQWPVRSVCTVMLVTHQLIPLVIIEIVWYVVSASSEVKHLFLDISCTSILIMATTQSKWHLSSHIHTMAMNIPCPWEQYVSAIDNCKSLITQGLTYHQLLSVG